MRACVRVCVWNDTDKTRIKLFTCFSYMGCSYKDAYRRLFPAVFTIIITSIIITMHKGCVSRKISSLFTTHSLWHNNDTLFILITTI